MFNDTEAPSLFDPAKDIAAVFIDFENMRLTVEEAGDEPFQMNKVLDYVDQNIGRVTIKRAYSNWHYVNPHMYNLLGNNVDLTQIYTRGTQRKNAADIRLTADAMEALFLYPTVTTYVIVASDSDYTGLIINLRKHGKKVVGIGTRQHTSEHLVHACNLFRFYRTIAVEDPHSLRNQVGDIDIQEAKDLLVHAMQRHRFADRPAVGRWLRWQMIQLAPSFDEADLGFGNFREFLAACTDVVNVTFDERYQEMKVELLQRPTTSLIATDAAELQPDLSHHIELEPLPEKPESFGGVVSIAESEPRRFSGNYDRPVFEERGYEAPPTFPSRPEDIKRSDYLRTLWEPRIYLYNRDITRPIVEEIFRVNGPGNPLSEYELEEFLLGAYSDGFLGASGLPRYELTQKTIYAVQKLLFWAGVIRFLEDDEQVYWKNRKREILAEFQNSGQVIEKVDEQLVRHFARFMPLIPEVLTSILQGNDSLEYARRVVARVGETT